VKPTRAKSSRVYVKQDGKWMRGPRQLRRQVQLIRKSFLQATFSESRFIRTPSGVFAVGTHCFKGEMRPLPKDSTLFEFTGFDKIAGAV